MQKEKRKIIIGARGSKLSLVYAEHVKRLLLQANSQFPPESIEIKIIKTTGDIFHNKQISEIGGKGVFSKQIEEELLACQIDLAVHSFKDLPSIMTNNLCVKAVVKRNDPRDAFLSLSNNSLFDLKPNAKIGTSSLRRKAQLNFLRSDLNIISMRGNIDTRINKLKNKLFDGIVLSLAGIQMLKMDRMVKEVFSTDQMLPAIAQGIIALQTRIQDKKILNLISKINDKETFCCAESERGILEAIGGDCNTAVGGIAKLLGKKIYLRSELFSDDGKKRFVVENSGPIKEAKKIGYKVGKELLKKAGSNFKILKK